jgi:hypothetical protein
MNAQRSPRRGQAATAATVLALLAIVVASAAVLASRPGGVAYPPTPSVPIATPSVAPTKAPTPSPSARPGSVDLDNATDHDVSILIHGDVDDIVGAVSGKPGDGMSVGWHKAIVRNVDANTIALTWVGLPGDDVADLDISKVDRAFAFTIVQAGPVPYSDAMGEDRVLVLSFDGPVSVDDISVEILDRTVD